MPRRKPKKKNAQTHHVDKYIGSKPRVETVYSDALGGRPKRASPATQPSRTADTRQQKNGTDGSTEDFAAFLQQRPFD